MASIREWFLDVNHTSFRQQSEGAATIRAARCLQMAPPVPDYRVTDISNTRNKEGDGRPNRERMSPQRRQQIFNSFNPCEDYKLGELGLISSHLR